MSDNPIGDREKKAILRALIEWWDTDQIDSGDALESIVERARAALAFDDDLERVRTGFGAGFKGAGDH